MVLVTYQLSSAVEPRQFMDSELCGEGRAYNNVIMFSAGRKGEFRVSLMDYWGVMCFHQCGRVDIEIDYIPEAEFADLLRDLADTFFVTLTLVQPMGLYSHLPSKVAPNEDRDRKVM